MSAFEPGKRVSVDTTLERTTHFLVAEDGALVFQTSSTPGVSIERVDLDGVRHALWDGEYDAILDALDDEGYAS